MTLSRLQSPSQLYIKSSQFCVERMLLFLVTKQSHLVDFIFFSLHVVTLQSTQQHLLKKSLPNLCIKGVSMFEKKKLKPRKFTTYQAMELFLIESVLKSLPVTLYTNCMLSMCFNRLYIQTWAGFKSQPILLNRYALRVVNFHEPSIFCLVD